MIENSDKRELIDLLRMRGPELSAKTVTLGFDGFIDSVVKVIRSKGDQHPVSYFNSPYAFGEYITAKGDKNLSIELETMTTKLGGNMPIMANAIAQMGPRVSCLGPLGYPDIHPVFRQMPPNCELHSYADPGITKVLEFRTGKIMLAEMGNLNNIEWSFIKETIGIKTFLELFTKSDLISLLNWSELDNSTAIWKGLLDDVLPKATPSRRPIGFFDLSDCSKRAESSIREAMNLLNAFSQYWNVVLSLNLNEAAIVCSVLTEKTAGEEDVGKMCEQIFASLKIDTVIIHSSKQAVARDSTLSIRKTTFIKDPIISSGSGDNFNAGFCIGKLLGLETAMSLELGHATSSLYMLSAHSPSVKQVLEFLEKDTGH
ncbi:MAG TPA: PfkB family carbohydrate kinase [Chryseolinea sp.]